MNVRSPLTHQKNVSLVKTISCEEIIENYFKIYRINVSRFFEGLTEIQVYKCLDTGYSFYFPFHIAGDSDFYKSLQDFEWYYMDWKWEHEKAYSLIKTNDKVLEIGSGKGEFVAKLSFSGINCTGLELNEDAVGYAQSNNIDLINESVQNHASKNAEVYDIVCSFQVMEHISEIREVIQSSVDMLKKGGRLIISVPNNESFLDLDSKNYLNMPPHHMGLWNEQSLQSLSKEFKVKLKHIYFEPLQPYHRAYFKRVMLAYFNKRLKTFFPSLQIKPNTFKKIIPFFPKRLKAFTIQAIFEKLN